MDKKKLNPWIIEVENYSNSSMKVSIVDENTGEIKSLFLDVDKINDIIESEENS